MGPKLFLLTISKKKILFLISFLFVLVSARILAPSVINPLTNYLSKTRRVDANVLLVEGWLPTYALRMAYDEFREKNYDLIITTGLKSTSDYFSINPSGLLTFYVPHGNDQPVKDTTHTIVIKAYSSSGGKISVFFRVFVNDSFAAGFTADKRKRDFPVSWKGSFNKLDSVSLRFINTSDDEMRERILYVKEIVIDNKIILPYQLNSVYVVTGLNRQYRIKNNYNSYADLAKNKLLAMGIDSLAIIDIPGKRTSVNRTLNTALAFRNWLKTSGLDFKGMNIVTLGTHARRTWMIYKRILGRKYNLGVISLPDYRERRSVKYRIYKTLRETAGIFYYSFVLFLY